MANSAPIFTAESNSEGQVNLADAFAIPADQEIEVSSLEKAELLFSMQITREPFISC